MKNKIFGIDIIAYQSKVRRITIWRRQTDGLEYPITATRRRSEAVTESSMIRVQRAQRVLAGFRVDEWPFNEPNLF